MEWTFKFAAFSGISYTLMCAHSKVVVRLKSMIFKRFKLLPKGINRDAFYPQLCVEYKKESVIQCTFGGRPYTVHIPKRLLENGKAEMENPNLMVNKDWSSWVTSKNKFTLYVRLDIFNYLSSVVESMVDQKTE